MLFNRTTKLRWRRRIRTRKRQVEDMGVQAEQQLEKNFFKRLHRLANVRRFVIGWVLLLVFLSAGVVAQIRALGSTYLESVPVAGGTFTEGILGSYTDANPLYAASPVDNAVAKLLFSGLLKFDSHNRLIGDLAERWDVDEKAVKYTVMLRKDLKWHDGTPLTAQDVVFTYQTIQNPDAKSPLQMSFAGISIQATDNYTVVFTLPNALTSFPYSLTNGIVPQHLLKDVPASQLRSIRFNTVEPVGSGPFKWETIEVEGNTPEDREERIGLLPFADYHDGAPKLQRYIIRTFHDEQRMIRSFENGELQGMAGLDTVPDTISDTPNLYEYNVPLTGQVLWFFKTSEGVLADAKLRQALTQAVNVPGIVSGLGYPVVVANSPLLREHVGYDKSLVQLGYSVAQANKRLDELGWKKGTDGFRTKGGNRLSFRMHTQSTSEYAYVSQQIQTHMRAVGVDVNVILQSSSDLQATLSQHSYDSLLYGISLGVDPDVFPYWHSTQADIRSANRLNLSEFKNGAADKALEAGRTRADATLRAIKYRPFLEAWRNEAPAVALYQPRFLYVTRGKLYNFEPKVFNLATDRYANVHQWMIRDGKRERTE